MTIVNILLIAILVMTGLVFLWAARTGTWELSGKPRRQFLRVLTYCVQDLRSLDSHERVRIAEEAITKYGAKWAFSRAAHLLWIFICSGSCGGCLCAYLWQIFPYRIAHFFFRIGVPREEAAFLTWLLVTLVLLCAMWFVVFVLQVRSAVRKRVDDFRCPHCKYSLVGLVPQEDGPVLCPECGKTSKVTTRGMDGYKVVVPLDHLFID